jgi:mono/diheme cytochrome c family protein
MNLVSIKLSRSIFSLSLFAIVAAMLTGCVEDPNSPGLEYMPDMYRSPSYETYLENDGFGGADSMSARLPVKGSIPRGFNPEAIEEGAEGYAQADKLLSPLSFSKDALAEGKDRYTKMCSHCHGKEGEADGLVVTNGGFPPPPNFKSGNSSRGGKASNLSAGKIYHTITYGVNMMGSHASQIAPEDRWKIVLYVQSLQGKDVENMTKSAAVSETVTEVQEGTTES